MRSTIAVLLLCLSATACMTVPRQDYNKAANTQIKRIGLVEVQNPAEYSVGIVHHPGMSFGLIGGLVAAADTSSKSKTFSQQQVESLLQVGSELNQAFRDALRERGYEVVDVKAGGAPRKEFLKDYPACDCDAFLDAVVQTAGYSAEHPSTPYRPNLVVPVRVVDAKSKAVLYVNHIFVSDGMVPNGGTQLSPGDALYVFGNFEELKSRREKAADGLKDAARRVAKRAASDL